MTVPKQRNEIAISNRSGRKAASRPIAKAIRALLKTENKIGVEVSVVLCGDEFIHELNRSYRAVDTPTDVLSFPLDDPKLLGDIVVSLDTAQRQAEERGIEPEAETVFLVLHGCLHLLGYDDATEAGYEQMIAKARDVAKEMGYDMKENWGSLH